MDKKAFDLAISTLILIILGILVLIGITYFLTDGFSTLRSSIKPFLDTTTATSIKTACSLACDNSDKISFCCNNFTLQKETIKCTDSRLEIECNNINCDKFNCNPSNNSNPSNNVKLQDCSRIGSIKECPSGFVCDEDLSGGLGPEGPLPNESVGGDKKCHKECTKDSDCPAETPKCVETSRLTEDYIETFKLCFI